MPHNVKKINNFILYQIHPPKTGGSSLRSCFRNLIGEAKCGTIGSPYSKIDPLPQIGQFVHCHNGFINIHKKLNYADYRYIISIRDPVDKFLSLCMQELHNPKKAYNELLHNIMESKAPRWKIEVPSIFWDTIINELNNSKFKVLLNNLYPIIFSVDFDNNKNPIDLKNNTELQIQNSISNLQQLTKKTSFVFTHNFIPSLSKAIKKLNIFDDFEWSTAYNTLTTKNSYKTNLTQKHKQQIKPYFSADYAVYNFIINNLI